MYTNIHIHIIKDKGITTQRDGGEGRRPRSASMSLCLYWCMRVYVCVYMYACMHACMHACVYTYIYIYIVYVYIYIYIYIYTCTYIHIYIYICIYMYICVAGTSSRRTTWSTRACRPSTSRTARARGAGPVLFSIIGNRWRAETKVQYVCTYIYIYTYTYMYVCMYVYIYIYMYIYTHTHPYIHL